jgi:hypothetical protein
MVVPPNEQSAFNPRTALTVNEVQVPTGSEFNDEFQSVYKVPDPLMSLKIPSRRV